MKITEVRTIPLVGATHDHGWPGGTDPNEQKNTLLEVRTDEGLTGIGSCYTSRALVEASLAAAPPDADRRNGPRGRAGRREAPPDDLLAGARGQPSSTPSAASTSRSGTCRGKALGQPVSRLLGGNYRDRIKPYASILFDDPPVLREKLLAQRARGFRAIKMGWRPFGRVSRKLDELLIKTARETVGEDVELMVDAGGSEQFWPHGVVLGPRDRARCSATTAIVWFEEALRPDDVDGLQGAPADLARPHRHRRGPHAAPGVSALHHRAGGRHHPARRHQVRRPLGRPPASAGWPRTTACSSSPTAGTRPSAWPPIWR